MRLETWLSVLDVIGTPGTMEARFDTDLWSERDEGRYRKRHGDEQPSRNQLRCDLLRELLPGNDREPHCGTRRWFGLRWLVGCLLRDRFVSGHHRRGEERRGHVQQERLRIGRVGG